MSPTALASRRDPRPFFTPKALAEYLGVSHRKVTYMIAQGRIPSYLIEGSRRISAVDVDAYLERNRNEQQR